jgi:hypothetical protein
MSFALSELLWVGVVPCGVAALVMFAANWLGLPARAGWAKSVGGGYVVGQVGLAARVGWRAGVGALFQPREAGDWLPWLVMAAVGITVLAAYAPRNWQRWIVALAAVVVVAAPARFLAGSVYVTSRWPAIEKIGVIAIWAAALAVAWVLLAAGRANGQARVRGGLLVAVAIGMAAILTLAGSFTYGELCGVIAASLTGALIAGEVCFSTPGTTPGATPGDTPGDNRDGTLNGLSGAAGAIAVALGGLILLGYFYAELTATSAALLVATLVAAGGRLPTAWPRSPLGQAAFRAVLCVVPLVLAIAIAHATIPQDSYR